MRDVDYLLHKGTYRLKALTPRAKEYFAKKLVMHEDWLEDLWSNDLSTEKEAPPPPKPVEYAPGAAPWDV
jgi:hypothetical protein